MKSDRRREKIQDRNERMGNLHAEGKSVAEIASKLKMNPDTVRAVLWRAAKAEGGRRAKALPDPGKVCRAMINDPMGGIADSQADLAVKIGEWATANGLKPISLATIKLWCSPRWGTKAAPTRRYVLGVGPHEVLLKFAAAKRIKIEG